MNLGTMSKFLIAVLLAAPVSIVAQGPPPTPEHEGPRGFRGDPKAFADHQLKFMTNMLSLTDEQQKQAATIFGNEATDASKFRDQLKATHEKLDAAIKAKNTAAVDQTATAIGTLTAQMAASRAKSRIAFANILTPEQQAKLDKFEADRPTHMGEGPQHAPGWRHRPDAPPHDSGSGGQGGSPEPPGNDSLV
jgi:Spy/CpxP family protein refolding chaperone